MNILILGNLQDVHVNHLKKALTKAGARIECLDTYLFPSQVQISWQPEPQLGSLRLADGKELQLTEIKSVFWRQLNSFYLPELPDPHQQRIGFNDCMSTVRTLIKSCPAKWVNSWDAYEFHKEKPLQLRAVKELGVKIPATLISNNPEQVVAFAQAYKKVIFKPVYGGSHTQLLTDSHLQPQRLHSTLRIAPVTFQEYIPGTNIRTYVIDNSIYTAEILTNSLDFREDVAAELIPLELPETVAQQCLAITKVLKLEWTAIDWRLKPTGEYIFLEANPSPMFIHFEQQTNFPITQKLVNLLMN